MEDDKPIFKGAVCLVVCKKCNLIQRQDEVKDNGFCTREKTQRGWGKCDGREFFIVTSYDEFL